MGKIITIANQKGGVGKTLTASSMASLLHSQGHKILTISLDPQRNFDMVAGKFPSGQKVVIKRLDVDTPSMLHVMNNRCTIEEAIVHTDIGDLARASSQLTQWSGEQLMTRDEYMSVRDDLTALQKILDEKILDEDGTKAVLYQRLQPIKDNYEFILVDTNPSLTLLTTNSLFAADYVIIPVFSEEQSTAALEEMNSTIRSLNYINEMTGNPRKIKILGILMTKCNFRTLAFAQHKELYKDYASRMGTRLFNTKIRQSVRATDYVASGIDLIRYDPKGKTTEDYIAFVKEFLFCIQEEESHA